MNGIIEAEGLDQISEEDWERIQPSDQLCAKLIKQLGRTVAEHENLEDLVNELKEKHIKYLEDLQAQAYRFMATLALPRLCGQKKCDCIGQGYY